MSRKDVVLINGIGDNLYPRAYADHKGTPIHKGLVSSGDRDKWNNSSQAIEDHISNEDIHVNLNDKVKWDGHVDDATSTSPTYHLKSGERELLNSLYDKIYPVGCVYSSVSSTSPTFAGTSWNQLPSFTIGTGSNEITIYCWERVQN